MERIISVKGLRKVYPMGKERVVALDEVSFDFIRGGIYCLLGTSGSGKSTLLNMLAGLEKPTKGEIIFNGKHIEKMTEKELADFRQKHIGFVFQNYNLLSDYTALENVELPLIFRNVRRKTRYELAKKMLTAVGLKDRMYHKPSEMSGGQQQRVSIARAFVNKPEVVFADEPTGNLDTKTTIEMMELITNMARENKQTLIIVTHDMEISAYADVIIHIRDGKIESVEGKTNEETN